MSDFKKTNPDQYFTKAIEQNLFKLSLELGKNPEGEVYNGDEIKWAYTGGVAYNRVFPLKLTRENASDKILSVLSKFRGWNTSFNLYITSASEPENISEYLSKLRIQYIRNWAGMAIDLEAFNPGGIKTPGVEIREIFDKEGLRVWTRLAHRGFNMPEEHYEDFHRIFEGIGIGDDSPLKYFLAFKDGVPVSSCSLYPEGDIAGIYWVATLPEARGQKLATEIVLYTLQESIKLGCKTAILQASEMGRGVYLKIGFKDYYNIKIFKWEPSQD